MRRQYSWPFRQVSMWLLIVGSAAGPLPARAGNGEGPSSSGRPILIFPAEADTAERAAFREALLVFTPAMNALDRGDTVDFPALRAAMTRFWGRFPHAHKSATLLTFYMEMFSKVHPENALAEWGTFVGSNSPVASNLSQGKLRFAELREQPLDLVCLSLDGRAVDLQQWRGKVVLIDFWATWCAPCIQQLPSLKRLYSLHHTSGFEILGVSLDRDEDRHKVIEFVSREGMTWPQHFGGGWQNPIVVRYGINMVPTTFLLDRTGRIAGLNLDRDLEHHVKRLLSP